MVHIARVHDAIAKRAAKPDDEANAPRSGSVLDEGLVVKLTHDSPHTAHSSQSKML
jgi:hypothetical protein